MVTVKITKISKHAKIPTYAHLGDAGCDLYSVKSVKLSKNGGRALIPTGIILEIPPGYAGFIQPRSGLAAKHGITCLNSPGLIDSGYRGEIKVVLVNLDPDKDYFIHVGDRIAQLVIKKFEVVDFVEVDEIQPSSRGTLGFGDSGR